MEVKFGIRELILTVVLGVTLVIYLTKSDHKKLMTGERLDLLIQLKNGVEVTQSYLKLDTMVVESLEGIPVNVYKITDHQDSVILDCKGSTVFPYRTKIKMKFDKEGNFKSARHVIFKDTIETYDYLKQGNVVLMY